MPSPSSNASIGPPEPPDQPDTGRAPAPYPFGEQSVGLTAQQLEALQKHFTDLILTAVSTAVDEGMAQVIAAAEKREAERQKADKRRGMHDHGVLILHVFLIIWGVLQA